MDAIIDRVMEWVGSREVALVWYGTQPIAAFGGRTAADLVISGQAAALRDFLESQDGGAFA